MAWGSPGGLSYAFLGSELLLIRALCIYTITPNVKVVHTAHHHLTCVAQGAATAPARRSHTEALALADARRIGNACTRCRAYHTTRPSWIHHIVTHIYCIRLSRASQVLSVQIALVIGYKPMPLIAILTRHQVSSRVDLISH